MLHSIPGRVRIRLDPHRGYHVRWDDLKEQLERSATATRVRTNPASHSIVVEYDPTSLRASDVCDHVNDVVARCWSPSAGQPGVPSARHGAERAAVFHPRSRVVHALAGRLRIRIDAPLLSDGQWEGLARVLEALDGIEGVRPNAASRSVTISFDPALEADDVRRMVEHALASGVEAQPPRAGRSRMAPLRGSLVPLALSAAAVFRAPFTPLFLTAGALPIFVRAGEAIFRRRTLDVHTLDAAAALVLAGQGQFQTASVMVCMVAVGDFIRDLTMQHAERALEEPFNGQLRYAWVVRGETKVRVLVSELDASDEVVVYPGELIPVDGTVVRGRAAVDQQVLTGESMPIDKEAGDEVYAGTVVRDGKLYLDAVRVGEETAAARVLQIVRDAPARETRAQNYAERFANRIVPYSFAGAAASMAITANAGRAASLLIVDYGTGIRVSAPTAVLSSMAWAARRGILVKGGRHLETLAEADTIVFDKTGTLTMGRPAVLDILACTDRFSPDEVLALAAATEQRFTHPVAEAITRAAHDRSIEIPNRESSEYQIGLGVEATVGGRCVRVGGERFMADGGVSLDVVAQRLAALNGRAASSLLVAIDGQLAGLVVVADPVRSEAPSVVRALRERGVREIVMLTGDHESVARRVGDQVGIQSVIAGVLPEEKASIVRHLRAERRGAVVVVGDGINDSPALAEADVGIAMRGGADVARETAHVALLDGNLWQIPAVIDISRRSASLIRQNWHVILYSNSLAIGLALAGLAGPALTTLISNGSGVLATLNSLRPLMASRTDRP